MHLIYGLVDPRDGQLRYIGKSKNGLKRPQAHWKHGRTREKRDHCHNWVRAVLADNLIPEIEVLDEWGGVGDPLRWLDEAEVFFIGYFRMIGANLTNQTRGGGGCSGMKFPNRPPMSQAQKDKISATMKGRKLPQEHRQAIAKGNREKRVYPEHHDWGWKVGNSLRGKKQPQELIEKRANSHIGMKYKKYGQRIQKS